MAKSSAFSTSNEYIKYTIEIIQNSQSVANNTSNVTVKVRFYRTNTGYTTYGSGTVYCKINGTKYSASVTSSQKITSSGIVLFTKTLNITHGSDGTKTLTCSAWIDHDRVTSSEQSYSQTLTTIPRKSTLTVSDGTLGTKQTLTVERKSTSFKHRITATCGSTKVYIKADGTTSTSVVEHTDCDIDFTPPLDWAKNNTTGTTVTVEWGIGTYTSDGTRVGGSTYTKKYTIPASVKPSLSVAISEATVLDWGVYVQSVSRLAVKITATTAYGSGISAYKTTIDGKTYASSSFTTEVLKGKGSLAIAVTITDKRGRTATYNGTINVLEYTPPSITNLSVIRCNSDGTSNKQGSHAKVSFKYKFASLGGKNKLATETNYKLKSATAYTPLGTGAPTNTEGTETHIFAADTTLSYDVEIVATDSIQSLFSRTPTKGTATIGTINKFMQWFKDVGISFGKFFDTTKPYSLQVGWDAYFDKNVYIKDTPVRAKRCVCGQNGNSDTNPWHKFASLTIQNFSEDVRISFKITYSYSGTTRFATLNACVRAQNSNGQYPYNSLEFESDTGIELSDFVMAYSGTSVGNVCELWVKLTSYKFCQFEVLSETSRQDFVDRWTLYNGISLGEAATPTSGYTQIQATRPYILNAYPVGSYYMSHNSTSPATLFGGTWQRIEGRFPYGCAASGTIGATGTHTTGSGSSSLPYVNVALWRRTA